jgi:hypothetical protein
MIGENCQSLPTRRRSEAVYRDILAFVLAANEYPAGKTELGTNSIAATQLVGKDGPKPLPTNALVRVTGCLTNSNDTWTLVRATQPARAREAEKITAEERKTAEEQRGGTLAFRLQNLSELAGFNGDAFKGRRALAKGALIRQSGGDRINVTSLETLAGNCAP